MRLSVCLCVCPHYKTKTAETKITELATGIAHHESSTTSYYIKSKVKVMVKVNIDLYSASS